LRCCGLQCTLRQAAPLVLSPVIGDTSIKVRARGRTKELLLVYGLRSADSLQLWGSICRKND
jgi:hypothetical protein